MSPKKPSFSGHLVPGPENGLFGSYTIFLSELGWMACVWRGKWLDSFTFGHRSRASAQAAVIRKYADIEEVDPADSEVCSLVERLQNFAAGEEDMFLDVPLNLKNVTRFQQRVIDHCRRIRPGQTLSYGELAEKAGSPRAARAVGTVMSKNRFPLIVPCHRVVASGGALGGYSAPDGLSMKRKLLAREGALEAVK
jgi:methylated-DNA-[protein]-cysteine S-methyltransferase